ncbi:hypothetical protein BDV09DRAFT_167773, partial [Aspergillus tetrazonus]
MLFLLFLESIIVLSSKATKTTPFTQSPWLSHSRCLKKKALVVLGQGRSLPGHYPSYDEWRTVAQTLLRPRSCTL